jgi:hypothetical protein
MTRDQLLILLIAVYLTTLSAEKVNRPWKPIGLISVYRESDKTRRCWGGQMITDNLI